MHKHFVPVFVSNEDYESGKRGETERELLRQIRANARNSNLRAGSVQVYLVTADLDVTGVLPVAQASNLKLLMPLLREGVEKNAVRPGPQLVPSRSLGTKPVVEPSQMLCRIAAAYKPRQKIVVEDWVVLEKAEWSTFVPASDRVMEPWLIDDAVARKLLVHLYPYALNWDENPDQISLVELRAEVLQQDDRKTVVSLRGRFKMTHSMYVRTGKGEVTSELTGFVVIEPNQVPQLKLITGGAQFAAGLSKVFCKAIS